MSDKRTGKKKKKVRPEVTETPIPGAQVPTTKPPKAQPSPKK